MRRSILFALAGVMITLLPGAHAAFNLASPLPYSGVRLAAIDTGEIGMSLFEGTARDSAILGENGGASDILFQTGSVMTFRVDGQTYTTIGSFGSQAAHPTQTVFNQTMAAQTWDFGDVQVVMNITLVDNAARFHLRVFNLGSAPHTFGLRHMLDMYLSGVDDNFHEAPYLRIPGQPGDLPGQPEIYRATEQHFRAPTFQQVYARRTPTGPDDGVHARITWSPSLGGTPPSDVMIANVRAYQNHWAYSPEPGSDASTDNLVLLYWGYEPAISLAPAQSHHIVYWYGRATPSAFLQHRVEAGFTGDEGQEDRDARVRLADAGQTVEEPFEVIHRGTLGPTTPRSETLSISLEDADLPPGWTARLLSVTGASDAPPTVTLPTGGKFQGRLRVTIPPTASGDDEARLEITARVTPTPQDVDTMRDVPSATIAATVAVVPRIRAGLRVDDATVKTAIPGGSATFNLTVTNQANLRDPLPILLETDALLPPGWRADFLPRARLDVERGASVPATLAVSVPQDEFGGVTDLVLRARVAGRADANTTLVSVRVAHAPQLTAKPDAAEKLVPPGGSRVFRVQFHNRGLDAVLFETVAEPPVASGWSVQSVAPTLPPWGLAPDGRASMLLTVRAPATAAAGERFEVPVVAIDAATRRIIANTSVVGVAATAAKITAETADAVLGLEPGETAEVELTIMNRGNAFDNVTLGVTTAPRGLQLTVEPRSLGLEAGATGKFRLRLSLPRDAPAGDHDLVLEPRSAVDPDAPISEIGLRIQVAEHRELSLRLDRIQYDARPGQRLLLHADVTNAGNAPVTVRFTGTPPGWTLRVVGDEPGQMAMNTTRRFELALLIPPSAPLVPHSFDLRVEPASGGPAASQALTVRLARADLRIEALRPARGEPRVGEPWSMAAEIANVGNGAATGVHVRLLVDGVEAEKPVKIERLPAGRVATATLLWVPVPGQHVLEVVAESDDPAGDARPDDNRRGIDLVVAQSLGALSGPRGLAPLPWLVPILAVGAALLLWRRAP